MKLHTCLITLLLIFIGGYLIFNNHRISNEVAQTEAIIAKDKAKAHNPVDDYLTPGAKEDVSKVIDEYYKKYQKKIQTQPEAKINLQDIKVIDKIAVYIKVKEGFSAKAYKDNTQYSNGYGTQAKSASETITIKEANIRLYQHIRQVIVPAFNDVKFTSIEQVYSAIDFSYNLGHNRFKKEIVNKDGYMDCYKMMAYNKVRDQNGNLVYSESLAQRRLENFLDCAAFEEVEVSND